MIPVSQNVLAADRLPEVCSVENHESVFAAMIFLPRRLLEYIAAQIIVLDQCAEMIVNVVGIKGNGIT